jgi:hypothetical protein
MSKYLVLWKANPATWPTDPKQALTSYQGATGGGDQLLKSGVAKEIGWLTNADGYAIFEADSKDKVLQALTPFHPLFTQTVQEIVPWEKGKEAILAGARMAASSK